MKPQWLIDLEAEPCKCEPCHLCDGRGNIRVTDMTMPEGWDLEPCDQCNGGIEEICERCQTLDDYYASEEEN